MPSDPNTIIWMVITALVSATITAAGKKIGEWLVATAKKLIVKHVNSMLVFFLLWSSIWFIARFLLNDGAPTRREIAGCAFSVFLTLWIAFAAVAGGPLLDVISWNVRKRDKKEGP